MGKKKRPQYTQEYKTEAIKMALTSDKPTCEIAKDIGVSYSALHRWIAQAQIDSSNNPSGALTTDERQELTRLRRELRQVKMERDFLKKATAFFARENS